jgi:hypothetical protein
MKKIVFTLLMFAFISMSFGQNKYQDNKNKYFVEAAAKEYDLNEDQKEELMDIRVEMVSAYMSSHKSFKYGDITKEEEKSLNQEASKTFHTKLAKITGKTYAEMKVWLGNIRKELKNM